MKKREYKEQYRVKTNPMLNKDFYKEFHGRCLPEGMTQSVSYFTPRMSRVSIWDEVVVHGYQAFIKKFIIDDWNMNFFARPCKEVVEEYARIIENTMGQCDRSRVKELHKLGYLPIKIMALPEGTLCPMHVPFFMITNTHPRFAWLPQALESVISAELWYPMITATVGHEYRKVVEEFFSKTCDENIPKMYALGNFDYRGDQGTDAAMKAASGWLLSFANTATVAAIPYMETMYSCDCTKEVVGKGANSTEHFVMSSNSAYDMARIKEYDLREMDPHYERFFLKKLLTEICPHENVSCVMDTYDFDNAVDNILPTLKEEILSHNKEDGTPCTFLVRGDSGNPVDVTVRTVEMLAKHFGTTLNSKGYKVLDTHVKALYGDSIQITTAREIYTRLEKLGFAASNVSLGVGSFSMHCIIENEVRELPLASALNRITTLKGFCFNKPTTASVVVPTFKPFTRDTFSSAIKACDAFIDGVEYPIYKDPKTDRETGHGFKKSLKGCCRVFKNEEGKLTYKDELTYAESLKDTEMITVFEDGELVVDQTLGEIRNRLNNNKF